MSEKFILTNEEFVEKIEHMLQLPTAFAYGTYFELIDDDLISKVYHYQRDRYHDDSMIRLLHEHVGKLAVECTAIVTEPLNMHRFLGKPSPSDLYKNYSTERYLLEDMPLIAGIAVYMSGHVGVYMGNNEVAEVTYSDGNFGLVKTKLNERPWITAFKIKGVKYE